PDRGRALSGRGYLLSIFSSRHHHHHGVDPVEGRAPPRTFRRWTGPVGRCTATRECGPQRGAPGGRSGRRRRSRPELAGDVHAVPSGEVAPPFGCPHTGT